MSRLAAPLLAGLLLSAGAMQARAQSTADRIVEWVENAPASDNDRIALGYPVPIPVDTPLPFAGFRSYAGLHARHQDLALTTPWVHPVELGTTIQGRPIWLYQLGDADTETTTGRPEQAMLTNAGIHAREWQTPEVATGIIELLALGPADDPLLAYLRENANILVIPVMNIDGFLQTQRYPRHNWLGTDPDDPEFSPRDGRMRRKNMRGADEDLQTQNDHLRGIDLNRNNPPYWASNPNRSSGFFGSLVYHGDHAHSEPETQILDVAAALGPADQLDMYTDLHSFSQDHYWVRNGNNRLAAQTEGLLGVFSNHHASFSAGKWYAFDTAPNVPLNRGIGTTDEYFTHAYQVPSWTLEVEPSNGAPYHAPLPGAGADYGGLGRNGHDGFILPESQVERVRSEMAQSFAVAYYHQSGPPALVAMRVTDAATGAVVFAAEWDPVSPTQRALYRHQTQALQLGREYLAWFAWDKPMRWRSGGNVTALPGQPASTLDLEQQATVAGTELEVSTLATPEWLAEPGDAPNGYLRYRDDALAYRFRIDASTANQALVNGLVVATVHSDTTDMTGRRNDADPATVARWSEGAWAGYENGAAADGGDSGGIDSTISFDLTSESLGDPFVIEPGTSAAWFDIDRNGEGFMLEILDGDRAVVYWFTYDSEGAQDWYVAEGEIRGNRILFPQLLRVSGGVFGPGFDPDQVERSVIGSADFTWSSCDSGRMQWRIDGDGGPLRQGRMNVTRLSRLMGLDCGQPLLPPETPAGRLSGSWYDPSHSGEGYVLEVLTDGRALVYWFSFDGEGKRRWFFGTGTALDGRLVFDEMYTTSGPAFGPAFDPERLEVKDWGALEFELSCSAGVADFTPSEPGFAAGSLQLTRLSRLQGLQCED